MDQDNGKQERVIYEEKPSCGRCGKTIVGVPPKLTEEKIAFLPRFDADKPLCRDCLYELELLAQKRSGRIHLDAIKVPLTPEEKARRMMKVSFLVFAALIMFWRSFVIVPLIKTERPLRHGTYETDAVTDRCINQLWSLSRNLQEHQMPDVLPGCPKTGIPYTVITEGEDTLIRCPNPEQHNLKSLQVSRFEPVPIAVAEVSP
ncbi:MAG: hypothetical protein JSV00_01965 [bacterium]|nr:MAG: hypothetical protein JSV00_01965 [bacterium]